MGQDPCNTPGAICQPRDYAAILKAEVDSALRHILSYRQWSFFFHQSNLKNYGGGKTLQYDWLNAVVGEYDKTFKLPLKSPAFFEIGADTANRVKARQATLDGYATLDASGNPTTVTIRVVIRRAGNHADDRHHQAHRQRGALWRPVGSVGDAHRYAADVHGQPRAAVARRCVGRRSCRRPANMTGADFGAGRICVKDGSAPSNRRR